MTAFIVLAGLGLLALPGALRHRLVKLDPVEWCRAVTWSGMAGLAVLQFGLLVGAAPTVLRSLNIHEAADVCHRLFGPIAPGGAVTGWLSALALVWTVAARRRARRHVTRTRSVTTIESWLGIHEIREGIEHVTIPSPIPVAYAVPGPNPQIVVSDRLREVLTIDEFDAVIRHETSHLRRGHQHQLTLACELDTVFPRLSSTHRTSTLLRLAVERVADEDAVTATAHRQYLRNALAKTAIALTPTVPAFTPADTIVERLIALTEPRAVTLPTRAAALTPLLAAAAAATVAIGGWMLGAHHLVAALASACLD